MSQLQLAACFSKFKIEMLGTTAHKKGSPRAGLLPWILINVRLKVLFAVILPGMYPGNCDLILPHNSTFCRFELGALGQVTSFESCSFQNVYQRTVQYYRLHGKEAYEKAK